MALLKKQDSSYTDTEQVSYISITPISKLTGLVTITAVYPGNENKLSLFEGPKKQAGDIIKKIGESWFTKDVIEIPKARQLTLAEERDIWTNYYYDAKKEMVIRESQYKQVIVRIKSIRREFNIRHDDEELKRFRQLLGENDIDKNTQDLIIIKIVGGQ